MCVFVFALKKEAKHERPPLAIDSLRVGISILLLDGYGAITSDFLSGFIGQVLNTGKRFKINNTL